MDPKDDFVYKSPPSSAKLAKFKNRKPPRQQLFYKRRQTEAKVIRRLDRKLKDIPMKMLITVLVVAGSTYQLHCVVMDYFRYDSISRTYMEKPRRIIMPSVTFCLPYRYFMGARVTRKRPTVIDIFESSPETKHMISSCTVRTPGTYKLERHPGSECQSYYQVLKLLHINRICYTFSAKDKTKHSFFHITSSYDSRTFFVLSLNSSSYMPVANLLTFYVYNQHNHPRNGEAFSVTAERGLDPVSRIARYNRFALIYHHTQVNLLPPPFVTQCMNYTTFISSQGKCIDLCLIKYTQLELNRVPFTAMVSQANGMLPLNKVDLENGTLVNNLTAIENMCLAKCPRIDCIRSLYTTITYSRSFGDRSHIELRIDAPHSPDLLSFLRAKMTIETFVISIGNVLNMWLGLSVFTFLYSASDLVAVANWFKNRFHSKRKLGWL
ncbi:hypothetical protein HDE_06626 [Halotydeus destructor]|nr:hypothetical protein HDE_06626 [Halotydeus destructor]